MKNVIRKIIQKEIAEYWKPYSEIEKQIRNKLLASGIQTQAVYCTGELLNMYVYVQIGVTLFVYNRAEDKEHAFLLKENNISSFEYEDCIAEILNINFSLDKLMRVVLINMCVLENFPVPRLNLSTGAIAAYIRLYQKARVIILDMQLRINISEIMSILEETLPDLIGISISFGQKNLSDNLIKNIQNSVALENSIVVVGNVIPSLFFKEYLTEYPSVIVSYAEGEESMLDLVEYAAKSRTIENVRGIAYKDKNGEIYKNKTEWLDISELPFPALDTLTGVIKYKGAITLEMSRGCNYSKCTFCPRAHKGIKWRSLSVDRMVSYFRLYADVCSKLKQEPFFYIADEEFIGQLPHEKELERMKNFCSRIKELGLHVRFDISARVDSIYRPEVSDRQNIEHLHMWELLKEIGLHRLFLGVESGCDKQLSRYNKGTTSEQNAVAIKLITALGINIRFGYITFDPLMRDFNDIITGHHFIERMDILYDVVDRNVNSLEEIYNSIVYHQEKAGIHPKNIPLYSKISYPLTSLEVLASTRYAAMIKEYESVQKCELLTKIDLNMARYKSRYVNEIIGLVSDACQKWIDYNFPVLYTLKGLYKTSIGISKKRISLLMEKGKTIDHYLLNYILYQLNIQDDYKPLYDFARANQFDIKKINGDLKMVLTESLNTWQDMEEKLIFETEQLLWKGMISDTRDKSLKTALDNWKRYRGIWKNIN